MELEKSTLSASEERFRALVTASSDVVYLMNADWTEMRHLVGRSFILDTVDPSRNWLATYIHPDDQQRVLAAITSAIHTRSVFELEHQVVRVDGTLGWTFSRAIPLLDASGAVVEWMGTASDITNRKLAEAALRDREERYRALFSYIDEGFCIFDMIRDASGVAVDYRFVEVNPAFEKHTGLVGAQGKTIREMVPQHEKHWFEIYGKVATTGEPIRFEDRGEGMHRWFDVYAFRLADERIAAVFTDITERRSAEEALRLSERRFSTFFSRSAVAKSIVRFADHTYLEANDKWCELFAIPHDTLVGSAAYELTAVDQHAILAARLAADGSVRDLEVELARRTGEQCIGLLSSQVLEIAGEKVILSSFLDITDRKRAEQALRDADRRKDEFLAVLSHELRNPLAPISNGLHILENAPPGSEQAQRAKQIIGRQVAHLSNLVDDLLDITRIVSGKVSLHAEHVDLATLIRRAAEDSRAQFDSAQVSLTVDVVPLTVVADATRLAQIVGNLLHNSAKFTPAGGHTRISLTADAGLATIRVVDDGVGMPPDLLDRVFEPFAQAAQTLDRTKGGLGLGLALVKGLVELHGGSVAAHSDGPGRGTELVVRLPLATTSPVEPAPAELPTPALRRIQIIEDNADAADTLAEILTLRGNSVAVSYDPATGIALARSQPPDIILCDIGLPDMDGYTVARTLRSDPALAGTFIIALSGYARPEDLARATAAGFDRHLAKPVNIDKLLALLAERD